jgi:nucleoside-diphosphate-sugar epimerase
MNLILTGVTGTLGSQVLYQILQKKDVQKFFLLVRKKGKMSASKRLENILGNTAAPKNISQNRKSILEKITVLETDEFLTPSNYLSESDENYFIHSASSVNLTTDESQRDTIFNDNLEFTKTIFNTFSSYLKKFTYVSTAFSIGDVGGVIDNDYQNKKPKFRNFYEASKLATEKFLIERGKKLNTEIQILRPSVLGGNIFHESKYFISKYMVYYLIGRFFHHNSKVKDKPVRLALNSNSGLNIVPVDYVAKVITAVFTENITQLNIVQTHNTNVQNGMKKIIESVGFNNYSFINTTDSNFVIEAKNKLEELYYKTVGAHLNKYITSIPYEFDTKLLESIAPLPVYNLEDYLADTILYAKNNNFKSAW